MRVDTLLTEILTATAAKTAAGHRITRLREVLEAEALRRYKAEGAAPSWKAPKLGAVRLDPKPAEAYVTDDDELAAYVLDRFPGEVAATIELAGVDLEAALAALDFAGVDVRASAARVRPSFVKALLTAADVTYADEPADRTVLRLLDDQGTAEPIPGTGVYPPGATLVVTQDSDAKKRALAAVDAELDARDDLTRPVETVDLPEAVALADQPADVDVTAAVALEEERLAAAVRMTGEEPDPKLVTQAVAIANSDDPEGALAAATAAMLEAGLEGEQVTDVNVARAKATIAERQRAHAEAHAADVAARLEQFAATGAAPATRQPGEITGVMAAASARDAAERDRRPYVGEGADGARRSAEIDRSELDGMTADDPLRAEREASAAAWDEQAARLDLANPPADSPGPLDDADVALATLANNAAPTEDPEPEVTALAKLNTDDLKRAARRARVSVSGAKVLLAARLHKAGVTAADVLAAAGQEA